MSPYPTLHHQTCRRWMSLKLTNNSHKRSWTNTNLESSSNATTQTTLNAASSRHRGSDVVQTQPISISERTSSNSPGYLKTHIIHSFLTILNYKTVCACRSSIMDIPPVPNQHKTFKFHNAPLVRKAQWKEIVSLHGSQKENGYITTSRIVMYAWLLTETESWTVRILVRLSYWDFPTGKMLAWPLKTRLYQVTSWFVEWSK